MTTTVVLMGAAGVGKSTIAAELVAATGWSFLEGDAVHSPESRAWMTAGRPLDDNRRAPWLRGLNTWVGERERAGQDAVLTCSALRRSYRDALRAGHLSVLFVHLTAPADELERRMRTRTGHFMPPTLLASQLATLEPLQPDEPGIVVPVGGEPGEVVGIILRQLSNPS